MGPVELLFSAVGRASRLPSVAAAAIVVTLAAIYETFVEDFWSHVFTGVIVYPPLFFCGACILSKRLHDRGRSGWWAAPILVSTVAVWPHPNGFLDFPFLLMVLWAFVELAVMPGEQGANRYGPNPATTAAA